MEIRDKICIEGMQPCPQPPPPPPPRLASSCLRQESRALPSPEVKLFGKHRAD